MARVITNPISLIFFFFNDTATTEIYTLSLHDALPISHPLAGVDDELGFGRVEIQRTPVAARLVERAVDIDQHRSEEHTSELQSRLHLVCRLLLEKKKNSAKPARAVASAGVTHTAHSPL